MTRDMIHHILKEPEYDFLRNEKNLGNNIILLGLSGSHAYGLDKPSSDLDIKGIATRRPTDILLQNDFQTYAHDTTDTTILSVERAIQLFKSCKPNIIELLWLDPNDYIYMTDLGEKLITNRQIFLSKNSINIFALYMSNTLKLLQQKTKCAMSEKKFYDHIFTVIDKLTDIFNQENKCNIHICNVNNSINVSGDISDINIDKLDAFITNIKQTYNSYMKRSKRNEHAIAHNKIEKHMSTILLGYMMSIDLLTKQETTVKRKDEHQLLMDIRNKKYTDENGEPNKEFFDIVSDYDRKYNEAIKITKLPYELDDNKIKTLLKEINAEVMRRN